MPASHYTLEGIGYRFETRRLAQKFAQLWPGSTGEIRTVAPSMYYPPVWSIGVSRWDGRMLLSIENTTEAIG